MSKQQEFLYIVQTSIIANCVNVSSIKDRADKYRHVISASGVLGTAADAFRASGLIPEKLTAQEAAAEFLEFHLGNLRDHSLTVQDKVECPSWCARY